MTPRTFWIIFLKIIGLWLLFSSLSQIPQFISSIFYSGPFGGNEMFYVSLFSLLIFAIIIFLVLRFLIFRPNIIIDKLSLDKGFEEERFEINLHRSSVLSIAIVVIGGIMLVDSLPELLRQIYIYFQAQSSYGFPGEKSPAGWIIFYFIKVFIAYYLITNYTLITNYIERNRRKNQPAETENEKLT
jgi:hypothetical protein